jgi:hypothetical protein
MCFPHSTHILLVTHHGYSEYELTRQKKAYAIRGCSFRFNIAVVGRRRPVGDRGGICAGARKDGAGLCGARTDAVLRRTHRGRNSKGFRSARSEALSPQLQVALAPLLGT